MKGLFVMLSCMPANLIIHCYTCNISRDTYVEREPGESSNDRNDRAIRTAAKWYQKHLHLCSENAGTVDKMKVVLLTNDTDNRNKAKADGIMTYTGMVMTYTGVFMIL